MLPPRGDTMRDRLVLASLLVAMIAAAVAAGDLLSNSSPGAGSPYAGIPITTGVPLDIPPLTPPTPCPDVVGCPVSDTANLQPYAPGEYGQPPIVINGVEIPAPKGAKWGGGISDPGGGFHTIERGASLLSFSYEGSILQKHIAPEDEASFQPTLD